VLRWARARPGVVLSDPSLRLALTGDYGRAHA
jgi:hypothetical protein